ncbi:MAG: LPS-assembly protein LptD [Gammaproteobacteria bacterium]
MGKLYTVAGLILCLHVSYAQTTAINDKKVVNSADKLTLSDKQLSDKLGWITTTDPLNLCHGYYVEPILGLGYIQPLNEDETAITADQGSFFRTGTSVLVGNIIVDQATRRLNAERAKIKRDSQTGKIDTIDLYDNVKYRENGRLITGDYAHLNADKSGYVDNVLYRIALSDAGSTKQGIHELYGLNAQGKAAKAQRDAAGVIYLTHATYSTCPPTNRSWHIKASHLKLDQNTGRGTAKNSFLYVKNTPVLYIPYYNFPIDDRRQTGLLTPTYGHDERSGFTVDVPLYLNLAPDYDATITPRVFTQRGVMLSVLTRYLTHQGNGSIRANILPNDREFKSFKDDRRRQTPNDPRLRRLFDQKNDRGSFNAKLHQQFNDNWNADIDYNYVSDDYFLQDFEKGVVAITNNQILQRAALNYESEHWTGQGIVQAYQTLHPINQPPIDEPYRLLPRLSLATNYPDIFHLDFNANSEYTYFDRRRDPNTNQRFPTGSRFNIAPEISRTFENDFSFLTPSMKLQFTYYDLNNQPNGRFNTIERTVPFFHLDAGMFFDRQTNVAQHDYIQTLEPRLYYLAVPYHDQDQIPNFDSGVKTFTFDELLQDNRFSGIDRVGDANQLSAILTSRLLDAETGAEKIRAEIGEIFYFRNRRVMLCDTPGCSDRSLTANSTSNQADFSPLVGRLIYNLNDHWSTSANAAYDVDQGKRNNAGLSIHYKRDNRHVINADYSFSQESAANNSQQRLNHTRISFVWPISQRVGTVGGWSYNWTEKFSQDYFYGIEYESCCWAVRAIGEHSFIALNQSGNPTFDDSFYIQFVLKGLGNIGNSDPTRLLMQNIPGYEDRLGTQI